jgi:UPF0755 protein
MIRKKILKIKLYFIIFVAAIFITVSNLLGGYLYLSGPLKERTVVIIKPGMSTHEISQKLADSGIINHPRLFNFISKIYSLKRPLKSGEYDFTYGISPIQVIRKLATGKSIIHQLIIPEGVMVSEIINKLNNEELLDGPIATGIPEGYLMPSTYFYSYGDKRENIIEKMRVGMSKALDEVMQKLPANSPLKSRADVLILASIIEKEAGNDAERARIAAVFINRLNKKMKLQADPTAAYAVTEGKYKLARPLTKADLQTPSSYNTYYTIGLPPGAIACPGKKSLEAAVNPSKTDDLYFVSNGQGGHNFSKTLESHSSHVKDYRDKLKAGAKNSSIPEDLTKK